MPRNAKQSTQGTDSKKRNTKSAQKSAEVVWGGFVNIKLDDNAAASFAHWLQEIKGEYWREIEDVVGSGLKYGLSWDEENQCFISTFVGAGVLGSNERYCLTARAGTVAESSALLVFKHVIMALRDWGQFKPSTGTINNWG